MELIVVVRVSECVPRWPLTIADQSLPIFASPLMSEWDSRMPQLVITYDWQRARTGLPDFVEANTFLKTASKPKHRATGPNNL